MLVVVEKQLVWRTMRTVIFYKSFDASHNVRVALMGRPGHAGQTLVFGIIVCRGWLGIEDKWYS